MSLVHRAEQGDILWDYVSERCVIHHMGTMLVAFDRGGESKSVNLNVFMWQ